MLTSKMLMKYYISSMKIIIKKFIQYLIKGEFKLVFNNNQDCDYLISGMIINTTNISWSNYLREAIDSLKKGRICIELYC